MMRRRRLHLHAVVALAAAVLVPASAAAQALARHPYLQTLTPSSVTVVWTTDAASASEVSYGPDPQSLTQKAMLAASATQHEVTITGLSPATRYYYAVGAPGTVLAGGDAAHYFVTAPPAGTRKKLRAWLVGDSGTGATRQAQVRDAMLTFAGPYVPDLYLHVGDMAYTAGTTAEFTDHFFAPYEDILRNTVVWPALGNHEGTNSDSQTQTGPYYTAYVLPKAGEAGGLPSGTEAYYAFDYANIHFIVLDSHDSPRDPGGAMLTWMQADLAATTQEWIIAYWHHPPYTKGSHDSDTEGQLVDMRENALPILEAGGVDLVLAGHSHIYERSFLLDGAYDTPTTAAGHIKDPGDGKALGDGPYVKQVGANAHDGAVYVVAGHGGTGVSGTGDHPVMYFSEVENGSCLLDVQENRLSLTNIRYDGEITDRFAMIKGTGIVVGAPDGGEVLAGGSTYDIRWATVGSVPDVKIEYSLDDGQSWSTIVASTPNTGTYAWTVPSAQTTHGLVRVSSVANAMLRDESNAGFTIAGGTPVVVIPFGDTWRYSDDGTDQGTAWSGLGFDDAAWKEGAAQLGYGDGDEATVITEATPAYPSAYFRRIITLDLPVAAAELEVLHDDGVAVFVNGTQVFAKYVDAGTDYASFASASSTDNELSAAPIALAPNPFVVGENVVAAIVKQASATSSDVSFDLELTITSELPPATGAGGAGGAGGTGAGGGQGTGAAGSGASSAGSDGGDSGCGCRTAGAPAAPSVALVGLALLGLARRRRAGQAAPARATPRRAP